MRLKFAAQIKNAIYVSAAISIALFIFTLIALIWIQPEVPIFYSLALPSQHLAQKYWLLLFPIISTVITTSHALITKILSNLDKLVLDLFSWSTVFVQILLSLSLLRVIIIIS
ncbi:MAG: hypothetical protein ABFQ62_02920 [Patescibacteria group bacterium]